MSKIWGSVQIAFVKDAKYYYRKRADGTSTLDTGWVKPSGYDEVLRYGCLATLQAYHQSVGYVPRFIQTSAMYYHIWQIKGIVNQNNALDFLTQEQKDEYLSLLRQMFEYIDEDAIDAFSLAGTWMFEKAGMLNLYKNQALRPDLKIAYAEKYDATKDEILLYYFAPKDSVAVFYDNGVVIEPTQKKILRHSFLDKAFVYEYRYWVPLSKTGNIRLEVDGHPTKIGFAGKHIRTPLLAQDIRKYYQAQYKYPNMNNAWIIMDRDVQADDNAEHFYRYVMNNHPEQPIYFALRKTSHDWARLEAEGFNLLDFGSVRFEKELKNCAKIISSHIDDYIVDYFGDKGLISKDFIFLPHGVTQNDLYSWYNSKIQYMSLMTVSTKDEHESIAGDNNHYKYGHKEIKLTGFPRHDALLRGNMENTKRIVVMPTWRKYLMGKYDNATGKFLKNPEFMQSEYAQKWQAFLASDELQRLIREYGYEVVFAPHKNTEAYLDEFNLPSNIKIWQANPNESIQKLFQTADMMITDYSSVAFEMGYLGKTVLYYQFDFDEFFATQWQRGYFEYETHGFGAVSADEQKLLADLEAVLANDGKPLPVYQARIENTFAHRDDQNSARVYQAILALDESNEYVVDTDKVYQSMQALMADEQWALVEAHARFLMKKADDETVNPELVNALFDALIRQGKYVEVAALIDDEESALVLGKAQQAEYAYFMADWQGVVSHLSGLDLTERQQRMLAHSYAALGQVQSTEKAVAKLPQDAEYEEAYTQALIALANQDWQAVIELLGENKLDELLAFADEVAQDEQDEQTDIPSISSQQLLVEYRFELILAQAYRQLEAYDLANEQLGNYEKHSRNEPQCRLEIARLAAARNNTTKVISQYEQAVFGEIERLALADFERYVQALLTAGKHNELAKLMPEALATYANNQTLQTAWTKHLFQVADYQAFLAAYEALDQASRATLVYEVVLVKYRLGLIDEAYAEIVMPTYESSYEYWLLVMELAFAKADLKLAKSCYQRLLAIYPAKSAEVASKFDFMVKNYEAIKALA